MAVVAPVLGASQRIGRAQPVSVAVVGVSRRPAVGVGHAGHLVEGRLVGVGRRIAERIRDT